MRTVFLSFFLLVTCLVNGQDYNASLIPDSLKQNAHAVKRFEELTVEIKSPSRAVFKRKWAITILNEDGGIYSGYVNSYSKFRSINDIDGNLYDATGKKLKSVKKKEISDISYDDQMSLMTDDRLKVHNFYYRTYPYTVEYEDEVEFDGLFFLPPWTPVMQDKLALQYSRFIVEAPSDYKFRYKQLNYFGQPQISNGSKTVSYTWELKNVPAFTEESYSPEWDEILPAVYLGATEFEFGGYKGNMESWKSLGQFMNTLYEGRNALPPAIVADVHRLVDGLQSQEEKVKALYDYLQKNTRYISIQLGIGGWQPFDASYVATRRYGDCKALSNYMVSLLQEAGIKANHVIINSGDGERGLWEDFPAPYFNHVIMCVPSAKDTMWLECTSQTKSPGYMGSATGNRKALLLSDDGGYVVSTPYYSVNDNLQLRKINAVVDGSGNLAVEVNTHFTGQQQELQHALIHQFSQQERERYLNERINLPTYKVESSDYKEQKGRLPAIDEYLKISAPAYASITGKRLFIQPNLFNKMGTKLSTEKPRKFDIRFDMSYRDVDTIHIVVPDGYTVEAMPKDVSLQSKWGKYGISFKINGNAIDVLRIHERYAGTYPSTEYIAFAKYMEDIYKADRAKVVLIKKE
jgi:hypothetical protein